MLAEILFKCSDQYCRQNAAHVPVPDAMTATEPDGWAWDKTLKNKTSDSRHDTISLTATNDGIDSNSVVQTGSESEGVLSSVRTPECHFLDPDTEMSTPSYSEDDILEYEMSEELEQTSSDGICTPSPPRPKNFYSNEIQTKVTLFFTLWF
ncbi:hypothetical protein AVEN_175270-1 [Araneus ventricosus]|uniref:Uncharacterized protein n=1 Tax=Araneus ventricosus TaxID=182803 RepID=A0A4Y2F0X5_ARAVE|nr:hypothetical protein AVEN_175270-1 [Araneus ventricosus]